MIEISNKMWEYMAKFIETAEALKGALKVRNLQYNSETKEIEEIEPELKEKDGNWYRCTQCVENFCEGRFYKSQVDNQGFEWIIDDLEHSYLYGFYTNYFRLATEEELSRLEVTKKSDQDSELDRLVGYLVQDIVSNEKDAANYGDEKKPTKYFIDKYKGKILTAASKQFIEEGYKDGFKTDVSKDEVMGYASKYQDEAQSAFYDGVGCGCKLGYDKAVESACKWLQDVDIRDYEAFDPYNKTYYMDNDKLIDDFKKALEKGE